jgi:hypothetical protein
VATEVLVVLGVENEVVPQEVNRLRRHGKHSGSGHVHPQPLIKAPASNAKVSRVSKFALELRPTPAGSL